MVVHNGSEIGNVKQDQKIAVASKKFILRHKISYITRFRKVPIPSWSLEANIVSTECAKDCGSHKLACEYGVRAYVGHNSWHMLYNHQ